MSNTTSAKATTQSLRWRLGPLWSLVSLLLIVVAATMVTTMFGKSLQVQAQYALVNLVIVVALQLFIGTSGVLSFGHVAFVHGEVAFSCRARCLDICEPLGPARHRSEKLGSGFPAAVIADDIPRSDCGASPRRTC